MSSISSRQADGEPGELAPEHAVLQRRSLTLRCQRRAASRMTMSPSCDNTRTKVYIYIYI
jgi:hypothetical protein